MCASPTSRPEVSVIVPVWGTERYLDACVKSILCQGTASIEVILVDDGSPDRAGEMCDEWASRDNRVRVIHQQNQGLSSAWNTGLDAATGTWVMFADSDDSVLPGFCDVPLTLAAEHAVDIVVFGYVEVLETGEPAPAPMYQSSVQGLLTREEALVALASQRMYEFMWNKLFRRTLFDGLRFPGGNAFFNDQVLTYHVFSRAQSVFATTTPLYRYLRRAGSLSDVFDIKSRKALVSNRLEIEEFLSHACPAAKAAMQPVIAKEELILCALEYTSGTDDDQTEVVRKRLRSRPVTRGSFSRGTWRDLRALKVSPRVFLARHRLWEAMMRLRRCIAGK